jgi:hypothetical protein
MPNNQDAVKLLEDTRFTQRRNNPLWRLLNSAHITQGCWNWTAYKNEWGYGRSRHNGTKVLAHRLAFELFVKKPADDLFVCHTCDNPACINPERLYEGTHQDNVHDKVMRGRQSRPCLGLFGDKHPSWKGNKHGNNA